MNEGWNEYIFPTTAQKPSYNRYRFTGSSLDSCRFSEVRLIGIVFIDDRTSYYECTPTLTIDNTTVSLNYFTVDVGLTPSVTSMNEIYGPIGGGQELRFIGTGFSVDNQTTVLIDAVECVITSQAVDLLVCTTGQKTNLSEP